MVQAGVEDISSVSVYHITLSWDCHLYTILSHEDCKCDIAYSYFIHMPFIML